MHQDCLPPEWVGNCLPLAGMSRLRLMRVKSRNLTRINLDIAFMEAAIVQQLSEPEIGAARLG